MDFVTIINKLNEIIWSTPVIFILVGVSIVYTVATKFDMLRSVKLQLKLLMSGTSGSEDGISPYETFCTVIAYRVAVGNVGGIAVAIMYGGPGAVFWMPITALISSAVAYAENSLGQIYKIRQDGQYRGGPYNYMETALGWRPLSIIFALLALFAVPLIVSGPSANNIGMAFENSFGINPLITGAIVAFILFRVISDGIRGIAKFSTFIVPIMTIAYLAITAILLVVNASQILPTLSLIVSSAFSRDAVFGGLLGSAFIYGVKRAVNSSGVGMGETPPAAAAAECAHPAEQGLINTFSCYVDVAVCICSAIMMLITDSFNVLGPNGNFTHIGQGSSIMAEQAASGTAGVVWVQAAANTVLPGIGSIIIALCLTFFAFSTTVAYYYEGEASLAYLARNKDEKTRSKMIWVLRIAMPIMFFLWSNVSAATAWAASEVALGLMLWVNGIALVFLFPVVIKVYNDYKAQLKAGKEPYFNPQKLGIKNADIWMDINKDKIAMDTDEVNIPINVSKGKSVEV